MPVRSPRPLLMSALALGLVGSMSLLDTAAIAAQPGTSGRFDTWVGYHVGDFPQDVATGDFDGDGAADAVWVGSGTVTLTRNVGDGTLAPAEPVGQGQVASAVSAVDLDGDADLDLVLLLADYTEETTSFEVLLNDGAAQFTSSLIPGGGGPDDVATGDFDGDGAVDLAFANTYYYSPDAPGTGGISVVLGAGDGSFSPETRYDAGPQPTTIVAAEVTGDGVLDLVAGWPDRDSNRYRLAVLTGNGDGSFDSPAGEQQAIDLSASGFVATSMLTAGDVDGDGDTDLAMGAVAATYDAILRNDGTGTFGVERYDVFGVTDPTLTDVDEDGDLDLLGVGGGGGTEGSAWVQRNSGDGTLAAPEEIRTSRNPVALGLADLDGDGGLDLLVANRDTGVGSTHLQRPDGTFAGPPMGSQFEPSVNVTTADFDSDGDLDVAATGQVEFVETVRILDNDGAGTLSPHALVRWNDPANKGGRAIESGDLDGDGDPDLAWLADSGWTTRVVTALNDGDGTFAAPVAVMVETCAGRVTLADVDQDGDTDILTGNSGLCGQYWQYDRVTVLSNDGAGGFADDRLIKLAWGTADVALVDLDGDGIGDLVAAGTPGDDRDLAIARGLGDGEYAALEFQPVGLQHRQIVPVDIDGDADVDLVTGAGDFGTVVLLNDGTGQLTASVLDGESIHGYSNAVGIAVGDVTGDVIADVVVANQTGSNVGVFSGHGDSTFAATQVRYGARPRVTDVELADLDGDGLLDIITPATVPSGFQATGGSTDDLADGGVNVLLGHSPACTIIGTPGRDRLVGTSGTDVICGLGGRDVIRGGGGGDILRGGDGRDRLLGGAGIDVLDAGSGNDVLAGGAADDSLRGGRGADRLAGGAGVDVVDGLDGRPGNDRLDGGPGADHCRADTEDERSSC